MRSLKAKDTSAIQITEHAIADVIFDKIHLEISKRPTTTTDSRQARTYVSKEMGTLKYQTAIMED